MLFFYFKKENKIRWFKLDNANTDAELDWPGTAVANSFPSWLNWSVTWILPPPTKHSLPSSCFQSRREGADLAGVHALAGRALILLLRKECVWPRLGEQRRGGIGLCPSLEAGLAQLRLFRQEQWWWGGRHCSQQPIKVSSPSLFSPGACFAQF